MRRQVNVPDGLGCTTDACSNHGQGVDLRYLVRDRMQGKNGAGSGTNTALFGLGPSVDEGRGTGGAVRTEHRPIQTGVELRFPPFAHRAFGFLGTGAVDEAWKTRNVRTLFEIGYADRGGYRRDRTSPQSSSGRALPRCGVPAVPLDGTSPHSNGGGVAFPTLRPPRLRLSGGPAPWTKRGKRTTAVALTGVGSAAGPRIENIIRSRPRATRKTTPS